MLTDIQHKKFQGSLKVLYANFASSGVKCHSEKGTNQPTVKDKKSAIKRANTNDNGE